MCLINGYLYSRSLLITFGQLFYRREILTELETTISLFLGNWVSTPLKQVHHGLGISSRRAVDSVLMILFQALHFSAQATPHKGPKSGQKPLLTASRDLILSEHMIVHFHLLGRHHNDLIQSTAVRILIMFMVFQLLMTRIPLALGRLGLRQKVKLQEEDLIIGVLFSLVFLPIRALFLSSGLRTDASFEWVVLLFGSSYL